MNGKSIVLTIAGILSSSLILIGVSTAWAGTTSTTISSSSNVQILNIPLTSQQKQEISAAMNSGNTTNAEPLASNALPSYGPMTPLLTSSTSGVPFSFTLTAESSPGPSGANTPHFSVSNGSVKAVSSAEAYTALNSGYYQITLFEDFWYGSTNEGTINYPYGQYSYETGSHTWTGLPTGSYNLSISTYNATVQGNGDYYP